MRFIYLVGAQCTGKTTLVQALEVWLQKNAPHVSHVSIREVARNTLKLHQFTRIDIRNGGSRLMDLQKLILEGQAEKERELQSGIVDLVLADRSGIDPLVYARMYGGETAWSTLLEEDSWRLAESNMRNGIIVVCEPVQKWLHDDGIRLMPLDWKEWLAMHDLFCQTLRELQIPYTVIPADTSDLSERVGKIVSLYQSSFDEPLEGSLSTGSVAP